VVQVCYNAAFVKTRPPGHVLHGLRQAVLDDTSVFSLAIQVLPPFLSSGHAQACIACIAQHCAK